MKTEKRILGKSGIKVNAMGLGCWAIGGPFYLDGKMNGYGEVDDNESIKAIYSAIELGVNFFDTADVYGAGHSERILGKALKGKRDKTIIATKFGYGFDEKTKISDGLYYSPEYIRKAVQESLKRLNTDYIDLYQLHIWSLPKEEADSIADELEKLVDEVLIKAYGWSMDDLDCVNYWLGRPNMSTIQHNMNVVDHQTADKIVEICKANAVASINRGPLGMGILTGKFTKDSQISQNDVRGGQFDWVAYFKNGKPREDVLLKLAAVREILTSKGRTLAQGALAWLWAKSDITIPIPGFKSVKQAEENSKALEFGPLTTEQVNEIENILMRQCEKS
jgi:aryl-alcohol dehydrogenase-like predicted oxidoreductase